MKKLDTMTLDSPSLASRIQAAVAGGELCLPPLPAIATRLSQLLQDEKAADPRTVSNLVSNEPAIAASILKLANSASFGGLREVDELDDAIARLGLRQVGSLVTAIVHKGNFSAQDPQRSRTLQTLWDHSVASAMATKHLASLGGDDRSEAFLAGLLHDVGKLLVMKALDQIEEQRPEEAVTAKVAEELMSLLHAQLGHSVLVSWKIPAPVARVALHHHDANPSPDDVLLLRVQAANAISRKLGFHTHPDPDLDLLDEPAIEHLRIGDLELATLMVDVEDEIGQVRSMF
jgi:HD-like signal output (HDOD) protein